MKVTKVIFDSTGFRNLRNLEINIAPRITVIAGHNGIGKSTVLGLIANGSELKPQKTVLNTSFRSDFSEIFHLNYEDDIQNRTKDSSNATLIYSIDNCEVKKDCKVTGSQKILINKKALKPFIKKVDNSELTEKQKQDLESKEAENPNNSFIYIYRMRVIPRTDIKHPNTNLDVLKEYGIEGSAKVPIPTIYLGMSRVSPIGEFETSQITVKSKNLDESIAEYIYDTFNKVILLQPTSSKDIHSHTFAKTNKQSLVPNFEHSSLSISLGQDSLSAIVTALASFKKLKLELADDYRDGILIIDEIEAGLHPKAQLKLMGVIQKQARELDLQVIVTSHSLTVMKYILDSNNKIPVKEQLDGLVYLMDTNIPRNMSDINYTKIKSDMLLTEPKYIAEQDNIKVYLEDDEAKYFFDNILKYKQIKSGSIEFGRPLESISLKIGSEILIKLAQADNYFKTAVLVADNDVASKRSNREIINSNSNFCVLPQSKNINDNTSSQERTPEYFLYDFLEDKYNNMSSETEFWTNMGSYTTNYVEEHVLNLNDQKKHNRNDMKTWFKQNLKFFDEVNLLHHWCEANSAQIDTFIEELEKAVNVAYQNLEDAVEFK